MIKIEFLLMICIVAMFFFLIFSTTNTARRITRWACEEKIEKKMGFIIWVIIALLAALFLIYLWLSS